MRDNKDHGGCDLWLYIFTVLADCERKGNWTAFFFFFTAFAFRGIAKPTTFTHHLDSYSVWELPKKKEEQNLPALWDLSEPAPGVKLPEFSERKAAKALYQKKKGGSNNMISKWGSHVNNMETQTCQKTHNFRLLLRHLFFGNEPLLLFLNLLGVVAVPQELFDELRTVQVVLRFPCVVCTVGGEDIL